MNNPEVISALIGVVGTGVIGGFAALLAMYVKINVIQSKVKENTNYRSQSETEKNRSLAALEKNNALLEQVLETQKEMKLEIHALKIELENVFALNPELKKPLKK